MSIVAALIPYKTKDPSMIPITPANVVKNTDSKIIDCKAKRENSIYIGANGNVTACCWTDLQFIPPHNDSRVDITSRIGNAPNLYNSSLREIFNSNYFNSIQDTWGCNPLKECAKQCGSFKKFEAQYEN